MTNLIENERKLVWGSPEQIQFSTKFYLNEMRLRWGSTAQIHIRFQFNATWNWKERNSAEAAEIIFKFVFNEMLPTDKIELRRDGP